MAIWNSFFKAEKNHARAKNSKHCLEVDLQELIELRFSSSGLNFASAFSNTKKAHSALAGGHLSPFKGRGLDFDEVRPYQPGDDIRNIDWNVTARTNRVHTKIFKEERERPVFIVADFCRNMHFATRGVLKSVQTAKLAALSAWIAADDHNRVGGVIFSESKQLELRPKSGHKGVLKLFNLLSSLHQQSSTAITAEDSHLEFDPGYLFKRLKQVIKPGSLIIFISDFGFLTNNNLQQIQYLAKHNDFIASFIYDPLEVELPPPGNYAITTGSSEHHKFIEVDTSNQDYRTQYRRHFIQRDEFLLDSFNKIGAHYLRLATNEDPVQVLTQFLGRGLKKTRVSKNRF